MQGILRVKDVRFSLYISPLNIYIFRCCEFSGYIEGACERINIWNLFSLTVILYYFFVVKKSTKNHGNGNLGGQTVSDLKRNEIHQHIWIKVYSNTWNIQRSINYIALSARLYFACACSNNINKMARVKCFNGI